MMNIVTQEALFYITAGLCTFLAIVVSYRWLTRQPEKKEESKEGENRKEKEKEKVKEAVEEEVKMPPGCPFGFGPASTDDKKQQAHKTTSQDSLGDCLIDSTDIHPLNDEEKKKLEEDAASITLSEQEAEIMDHRKVKEIEEEVVKSMTDQQLNDEAVTRQTQLEAIFNLMEDNRERFGMTSVDDVQNQYKLYV